MKKRIISVLLVMCMLFAILPVVPVVATATANEKNITLGYSALKGGQQSNVYYGVYPQNSYTPTSFPNSPVEDTVYTDTDSNCTQFTYVKNPAGNIGNYFKIEPLKWRVLDNENGKAFLVSDKNIDVYQYYEKKNENITWEESQIRSWLNGYTGANNKLKKDYSNTNFINFAFSTFEKTIIADTTVINNNNGNINAGKNTIDKVFLLSIDEVSNTKYFPNDNSRAAVNTSYVAAGGHTGYQMWDAGEEDSWWLRSPGDYQKNVAYVCKKELVKTGEVAYTKDMGVRPALNLNLSSVLFTSVAVGGKTSESVEADGTTGIFKNKDYTDITGNDGYKLTLLDESRSSFKAALKSLSGYTATVSYSGAITGTNEYISVIIKNGDTVKYYGRIATVSNENGEATFTLPDDFSTANGDVLCVFNEQHNGDKKTDYASKLIDVTPFDYTVNFNANGGDGTMASQTMTYGATANLSTNTFTRSGYTFNGWNTKADGKGIDYSDEQSVTNLASDASMPSVTLYAQWTILPPTTGEDQAPPTGDNSHMVLCFALLFASAGALAVTVAFGRKRKHFAK